ncbi:hypothetical protein XELAEV_18021388mg [Xenopus laevis]|uniref:Uncharacterized protein n=1 Tax=Xenopus laevis TaxID=8355 RepID=A0A974DB61_XENLA|nr:hypothetical protein XELAEV_18021388mg [Xenopus laevis]
MKSLLVLLVYHSLEIGAFKTCPGESQYLFLWCPHPDSQSALQVLSYQSGLLFDSVISLGKENINFLPYQY